MGKWAVALCVLVVFMAITESALGTCHQKKEEDQNWNFLREFLGEKLDNHGNKRPAKEDFLAKLEKELKELGMEVMWTIHDYQILPKVSREGI